MGRRGKGRRGAGAQGAAAGEGVAPRERQVRDLVFEKTETMTAIRSAEDYILCI